MWGQNVKTRKKWVLNYFFCVIKLWIKIKIKQNSNYILTVITVLFQNTLHFIFRSILLICIFCFLLSTFSIKICLPGISFSDLVFEIVSSRSFARDRSLMIVSLSWINPDLKYSRPMIPMIAWIYHEFSILYNHWPAHADLKRSIYWIDCSASSHCTLGCPGFDRSLGSWLSDSAWVSRGPSSSDWATTELFRVNLQCKLREKWRNSKS